MNSKMVRYILGKMLGVEGLLFLLPIITGLIYGEKNEIIAFLIPGAILALIYVLVGMKKPEKGAIYRKEGMVIVACAWLLWSAFGALPFVISGCIPNFIDAFFETVSGFTTTGSTILTDIEAMPKSMLFWRSFTHWIGGMGVLVFVMVLTTLDKKNSMYLMSAEVPGPEKDKLVPKSKSTARILYGIYFGMTLVEVILLMFGGMNLYDSLIHSFGTAGTGGFSNYAASVGHFDSVYIDTVVTIFMILFGINFNLYFFLLLGEFKAVWKNEELRVYLGMIATITAIIVCNTLGIYGSPFRGLRYAVFQVASVITTTGYATADYVTWPMLSQCLLVLLMITGACASSTGGGIKITRAILVIKCIARDIKQMIHPKSVNVIKVNGKRMDEEVIHKVNIYLMAYAVILITSVLIVSIDNFDFATTLGSVLTTIGNVGPGLNLVGPSGNFAAFSPLSKIVLCIDMLAGRLEIFPFLTLFTMFAWKRKF